MEIRRIRADEATRLRALRLRALAGAPDAFGTTLAAAAAWPDAIWEELARRRAAGEDEISFLAEEGDEWLGMVAGVPGEDGPGVAELISMWVEPAARGCGVGRRLIEAVVGWAREQGARTLTLWVTQSNAPAIALYTRAGFSRTGATQPHPSNPALSEVLMARSLDANRPD